MGADDTDNAAERGAEVDGDEVEETRGAGGAGHRLAAVRLVVVDGAGVGADGGGAGNNLSRGRSGGHGNGEDGEDAGELHFGGWGFAERSWELVLKVVWKVSWKVEKML